MLEYGYYWVEWKTGGKGILEFSDSYGNSWLQTGWDAPIDEKEFMVICKVKDPE